MTNMTLAIPDKLYELMRKHKQIKWSEVARQSIQREAEKMELMEKLLANSKLTEELLANSKLTEEDALEMGKKINKEISKRHASTK